MKFTISPFVCILFCLGFNLMQAQQVGDFRSVGSGNWTSIGIWETYNGTTWTAATSYPGQNTGTNDVFIEGGYSVSISSSIPNTVNSLIVGDGIGALDNFYISNTASLPTQLVTIADGGYAEWTANKSFYLPSGAAFVIESGGELSTENPCSAGKRLVIGSVIYSTCNGGAGADYTFQELNDSGGSLAVSPSSNSPVCEGQSLYLFANPSGTGASGANYSWSGPSGYSSTNINPIVSALTAGTYTYTVTITDSDGNTNTNSTTASIFAAPNITSTTPGSRIGTGAVTLGATAFSGTLSWFSIASGGSAIGSGTSFITPSISVTTTYYVEASDNGCISESRTAVIATILGDTDEDGVADISDLDDDNDGILDSFENECVTNTEVNSAGYATDTNLGTGNTGTLSDLAANGANNIDFNYTLTGTATWNNGLQIRDDAGAVGSNTLYLQPTDVSDGNGSALYEFVFEEVSLVQNITFGGIEYDDRLIFEAFDINDNPIPLTSANFTTGGSVTTYGNEYTYIGLLQSFTSANYVNETASISIESPVKRIVVTSGKSDNSTGNNTIEIYHFSYCTITDSDGDSIGDYLELDSDNDGCSDADEAYYGTLMDADPDNDGLYGTGTPTVDADGLVVGAYYSSPDPYFQSSFINTCTDTDNDGVADFADLDDENDGILDTDEGCSAESVDYAISNGNEATILLNNGSEGIAFDVTRIDNSFNLSINGVQLTSAEINFYSAQRNVEFADGTFYGSGGIQQVWQTTWSTPSNYETPFIRLIVHTNGDVKLFGSKILNGSLEPMVFTNGLTLNAVSWSPTNTIVVDQEINGSTFLNGRVSSLVQDCIIDTDGDGTTDNMDLDSDNDTCFDTLEAGFVDSDADGVLGTSPVTVDTNGVVTGQGGYGTPADGDGNLVYDFQEVGAAPSITSQPSNTVAFAGSSTTFSVVANNTYEYQWQISSDGGTSFTDLAEGGIYTGTDTPTLNIITVDLDMNNYQYRVIGMNTAFVCSSPIISNNAILNVRVRTVITNRRITYRVKKN